MIDQESFYSEVGQRIKSARLRRSMSQEQLGERLGLSRASIANIENGRQKLLAHMIVEVSEVLLVPVWEILPSVVSSAEMELEHQLGELPEDQQAFVNSALKTLG